MKTILISPTEVADMAFRGSERVDPDMITETNILLAQQKFIKPALGHLLYEAIRQEHYNQLLEVYIKPPLALYIKALVLPDVSIHVGSMGVVQHSGGNFIGVSPRILALSQKRAKADALSLLLAAIEHIELNHSEFPEYDSTQNILNQTSITGGVIL